MTNERMTQNTETPKKSIQNVRTLDLTGMQAADLAQIEAIRNVGILIVPAALMGALAHVALENVEQTVPVPAGKQIQVRTINGPAQMGGEALVSDDDTQLILLLLNGPLIFTTPVTQVQGYELMVNGPIFAPQGSDNVLSRAIRVLHGPLIYYNPEGEIRVHAGQAKLTASALANEQGNPTDLLFVGGQMLVSGEIKKVGYKQIYVGGQAFIPKGNEDVLAPYLQVFGQAIWYSGELRTINGNEELGAAFFEYLAEPVTLIINGIVEFQADVTPELLRAKVTEIVLNGIIESPAHLAPLLQVLTKEKNGMINVANAEDE
ncbi:MAG: hypothetical protein R3C14_09605 [Caldilineaceae bacterium]